MKQFESHPERLSLVFEPEAAAAWCKMLDADKVSMSGDTLSPYTTQGCFLTVDVGGGTIDVTAHQIEDGKMKMHNLPYGRIHGGTVVNENFKTFLAKIVHDEGCRGYVSHDDSSKRKAELLGILYVKFEQTKRSFASDGDCEFGTIELGTSFSEYYQAQLHVLEASSDDDDDDDGPDIEFVKSMSMLQLSAGKMETFFTSTIEEILKCIDETIAAVGVNVEMIYLVGGFGGCPYIAKRIRSHFDGRIRVFVPHDHELAVVRGACVYHNEGVLRTADATYGTDVALTFDDHNDVHLIGKVITNSEGNRSCANLFKPFVQIGDVLDPGFVHVTTCIPFSVESKSLVIDLYSTKKLYTHFTRENNGELSEGVRLMGWVEIDISKGMHLPRRQREIEIIFDFSSIEILIHARFIYNKDKDSIICKAATDFLSTLEKVEKI